MTVPTEDYRIAYNGDGASTVFAFAFRVVSKDHIQVYVAQVLKSASLYVVKLDASGVGGTVTFLSAPANGAEVVILRESDLLQDDHLQGNESLPPATIERMIDKIAIIGQQLSRKIAACLRLADSVDPDSVDTILPQPTAGQILRWNLDADGLENVSPAQAFNDSVPSGGGGNVMGPITSTDAGLVVWDGVNGQTLQDGPAPGAAGNVLKSDGASWSVGQTGGILRAKEITASQRALPTSGALSGTYVHYGDWTSTGSLTFAHGTRIYLKGNMTLNHTLAGTALSNGALSTSKYAGEVGCGAGAGNGGIYVHTVLVSNGGGGGGSFGAGGNGATNSANAAAAGGAAHSTYSIAGGGGGSGSGDATVLGQAGGGGGAAIYIEVDGNIADNETTAANGSAGSNGSTTGGAGGGGGGGQIVKRCTGTYALAAAKSNSAVGGAGGNTGTSGVKGGGGGGGLVEIWSGGAQTISGTNTVAGGAKGTGSAGTQDATDGSAGVTTLIASAQPISLF